MPETIRRPPVPVSDQVAMPLLARITQQSLDEDYLHVAERNLARRTAGLDVADPPRSGRLAGRHTMAAAVIAIFGLLIAVAAVQTSRDAPVDEASRAELISQITGLRTQVASLQNQAVRLRAQDTTLGRQAQAATAAQQVATVRERRLQATTGFGAVSGPGLRATVDDAPPANVDGQVRDQDLALLVDGLWSAGATAISINGNRLTALSSIRNSGVVIRINGNNVSLSPPYVVSVVGDPKTLQADFSDTVAGQAFQQLVDDYGIGFDLHNVDEVDLPAAPAALLRLRSAQKDTAATPRVGQEKSR